MLPGFLGDKWRLWIELARIQVKRLTRNGNGFPVSFAAIFFSFYVLHADAGEKSPRTQEIETRNSSKNKNKNKNTGEGCLDTVKTRQ